MFISNCKRLYIAGPVVTVDEMLAPFRGRVSFRMYIPLKPAKYGLKLFMVNDARSQYALNAIPYLGKHSVQELARPADINQGEFYTMALLDELRQAGRVVVCDSWFTSLHLAQTLRSYDMHLVGTICMNKPYLPTKTFIKDLKLPKDDTVALHNHQENMSLVVKKVRASKYVGILSTLHNNLTVVEKTKTEAHMFYNAGKGGTDAFDQRCAVTSCSRKSRRWTMAMIYQMVNIGMNNAYILYNESNVERNRLYNLKANYLHEAAYRMCRPWAVHKYRTTNHRHRESKTMLDMAFKLSNAEKGLPVAPDAPEVAPPDAPDAPEVAPPVAPAQAAAPPVAPAQAAAAAPRPGRPFIVPAAVAGATRDVPKQEAGEEHPYLGGRWTRNTKIRCSLCPQANNWRGKYKCESPDCGHRDVCVHHSVILCQCCFYKN